MVQKPIGLLWDSVSNNIGDQAIGLTIKKFCETRKIEFEVVNPFNIQLGDYSTIIIGGGELIRKPGDLFYDQFRIPGKHILNVVGLHKPSDLEYLVDYKLLSVRSTDDKKKLSELLPGMDIEIKPCTTLMMQELFPEIVNTKRSLNIEQPVIGLHFNAAAFQDLPGFLNVLVRLNKKYPLVLFPFTLYQNDVELMKSINLYLPNSKIFPSTYPLDVFRGINDVDLMISTSLHAGIFAYTQGKQILSYPIYSKIKYFFVDRNLDRFLLSQSDDLLQRVDNLLEFPIDYNAKIIEDKLQVLGHLDRLEAIVKNEDYKKTKNGKTISFRNIHVNPSEEFHKLTHENIKLSVDMLSRNLIYDFHEQQLRETIVRKDELIDQLQTTIFENEKTNRLLESNIEKIRNESKKEIEKYQDNEKEILLLKDDIFNLQMKSSKLDWDLLQIESSKAYKVGLALRKIKQILFFGKGIQDRKENLSGDESSKSKKSSPSHNRNGKDDGELLFHVDTDIPQHFTIGKGSYLFLKGWCFHTTKIIRRVSIFIDKKEFVVHNHSFVREDVLQTYAARYEQSKNMLHSGFWCFIPITEDLHPKVNLSLVMRLAGGQRIIKDLGVMSIEKGSVGTPENKEVSDIFNPPLVAICMATYNPPLDLLRTQIKSLFTQTYRNWICIINDDCSKQEIFDEIKEITASDTRFVVSRNVQRLGHYSNFEQTLRLVPPQAEFVSFCDQDDEWYPEKIAKCLSEFTKPDDQLVYCDMDIVNSAGDKISNTFWTHRRNNFKSLEALIFANTVTGAALVFRSSLLPEVLPFPHNISDIYHDNWVACCALSKGNIRYIDEPLYAYHQHGSNAYGIQEKVKDYSLFPELKKIFQSKGNFSALKYDFRETIQYLDKTYFSYLLKIVLISKTLLLRRTASKASKNTSLKSIASGERRISGLVLQSLKFMISGRPTLGYEYLALRSYIGHKFNSIFYKVFLKKKIGKTINDLNNQVAQVRMLPTEEKTIEQSHQEDSMVNLIERMIAPLKLVKEEREPVRVNILIATVNFKYIFGGYLSMFNLALNISKLGFKPRFVIVENCDFNPQEWRKQIIAYPGLETLFDDVEFVYHFDRSISLLVNQNDHFIATSCWTAHIAHRAVNDLGHDKFIFFAQEYEPIFFPMSTMHALSHQSYFFDQYTVFSTDSLREYFKENKIGVYEKRVIEGDQNSIVFNNAITSFNISKKDMLSRKTHKFLFYARPETHASRNMYELGILGLKQAIDQGTFTDSNWEFYGIGTIGNNRRITLGNSQFLNLLPKVSLKEYIEILPGYDLGLSLMLSPHPSLVPLEMAAAGLVTVTNTYANKTSESLKAISSNIIGIPPTISGISEGLRKGSLRVSDIESRILGSKVNWPFSWEDSFNSEFNEKLAIFIKHS